MLSSVLLLFISLTSPIFSFVASRKCFSSSEVLLNDFKFFSEKFKKKVAQIMLLASNLCSPFSIFFYFLFLISDQIRIESNRNWFICGLILIYLDSLNRYKNFGALIAKKILLHLLFFFIILFSNAFAFDSFFIKNGIKYSALLNSLLCMSFLNLSSFVFRKVDIASNFYIIFLFFFYSIVFLIRFNANLLLFSCLVLGSTIGCFFSFWKNKKYLNDKNGIFFPGIFYSYICFTFFDFSFGKIGKDVILLVIAPYFLVLAIAFLNKFLFSIFKKKIA